MPSHTTGISPPAPVTPAPNATSPPPPHHIPPPPARSPPPPHEAPPPSIVVTPPPHNAPPSHSSPHPHSSPPPPHNAPPSHSSPHPHSSPPPPHSSPPPLHSSPPAPHLPSPPPHLTPPPPDAPLHGIITPPSPPGVISHPPPPGVISHPPPPGVISHPPPPGVISHPPPPGVISHTPPPQKPVSPPPHSTPGAPVKHNPPPHHVIRSPPPPASNDSSWLSPTAIIGITAGSVAVLLAFCLLLICCKKKKRRRGYYPPPIKNGNYGGPLQHWQQNAVPPQDHVIKLKRTPSSPKSPLPVYKPPPPPPFINSSGSGSVSESNYSSAETQPHSLPSRATSLSVSKSTFTYEELAIATNGFSDANILGQGGFGYVHHGVLPNGKEVAVKSLKSGSGQGEREFQAEVEIISRVHHKHLVSLVGYCIAGSQRMLVYEFVPNNTMEFHLHGKDRPTMNWLTRMKIAMGSAKGLAYLHEDCHPKIIHRDIKASNILLDSNFEAKVADFGLAKMNSDQDTHVSTRVMGTFGYLAPEYASSGKLTEKSDVFSFGVMLLELITGRRPVASTNSYMDDSLVDWARPRLMRAMDEENFENLVDSRLEGHYNTKEMVRMVACAAACVRHSARRRPKMSQIVRALEGEASLSDLNEGIRPGSSSVFEGSDMESNSSYNEQMKIFRQRALESNENVSSEYSAGPGTSEYGLNPSVSSGEGQNTREMEMRMTRKQTNQRFSGRG